MTTPTASLATPYRTHTAGQLRAVRCRHDRPAGRLGPSAPRPRPADLPRPARPPRPDPGRHRQGRRPGGPRDRQPGPQRVRRDRRGRRRPAPRRGPRTRACRPARSSCARPTSTILSEAKTPPFYINEPDAPVDESLRLKYRYLDIRRQPMADRLLAAQPHGPEHPPGPSRERVRRGRDADAHQVHPGGRPRLHRPEPAPAGQRVRPAAEPAAAQAAAHGRGHGPLLPDRALLPRRGPARRPPAGVHPARPRDELRRRGGRDGLHRDDGHRGLARRPRPTGRSSRCRSRASPTTRSSSASARTSRTCASGWSSSTWRRRSSTRAGPRPRASACSTARCRAAAGSRPSWRPGSAGRPARSSTS